MILFPDRVEVDGDVFPQDEFSVVGYSNDVDSVVAVVANQRVAIRAVQYSWFRVQRRVLPQFRRIFLERSP